MSSSTNLPFAPPFNISKWLLENRKLLESPPNYYCVYPGSTDYMVIIIGGPNIGRTDFHVSATEEWYFGYKGNMTLRVVVGGEFHDITIAEGEMLLLPPNVPHSPIQDADAIGIVIERVRPVVSIDRFQWYCPSPDHPATVIREGMIGANEGSEEMLDANEGRAQINSAISKWGGNRELRECNVCGKATET